jgi:hypothetical protein
MTKIQKLSDYEYLVNNEYIKVFGGIPDREIPEQDHRNLQDFLQKSKDVKIQSTVK